MRASLCFCPSAWAFVHAYACVCDYCVSTMRLGGWRGKTGHGLQLVDDPYDPWCDHPDSPLRNKGDGYLIVSVLFSTMRLAHSI